MVLQCYIQLGEGVGCEPPVVRNPMAIKRLFRAVAFRVNLEKKNSRKITVQGGLGRFFREITLQETCSLLCSTTRYYASALEQ